MKNLTDEEKTLITFYGGYIIVGLFLCILAILTK